MAESPAFVLVVVSDRDLRRLIGRVVEELDLVAILFSEWDASCALAVAHARAVVIDLDDLDHACCSPVFPAAFGGRPAPLIAVSRRTNVGDIAPRLGAIAGLAKPVDVGRMLEAIGGVVQR